MSAADTAATRLPRRDRPTYQDLLDLLADARADLLDADEAIWLSCFAVHVLAQRAGVPPRDIEAERRVLGAMTNGSATLRDVAGLELGDFLGDGHQALFAALLDALRGEQAIRVRVRPSARRDPAERNAEAARVRRRCIENALAYADDFAAWCALAKLPRPAACPRRDIVRVEELGRWRRGS